MPIANLIEEEYESPKPTLFHKRNFCIDISYCTHDGAKRFLTELTDRQFVKDLNKVNSFKAKPEKHPEFINCHDNGVLLELSFVFLDKQELASIRKIVNFMLTHADEVKESYPDGEGVFQYINKILTYCYLNCGAVVKHESDYKKRGISDRFIAEVYLLMLKLAEEFDLFNDSEDLRYFHIVTEYERHCRNTPMYQIAEQYNRPVLLKDIEIPETFTYERPIEEKPASSSKSRCRFKIF